MGRHVKPKFLLRGGAGPADKLAREAGVDLCEIALVFPHALRTITKDQVRHRVAGIRKAARVGGLCQPTARYLASLLKCDQMIFLRGFDARASGSQRQFPARRAGPRAATRRNNPARQLSPQ